MGGRKHRRSTATEVDGLQYRKVLRGIEAGFGDQGIDEGCEVGVAGRVFVKRTVRANAMAEGDVEVEVHALRSRVKVEGGRLQGFKVAGFRNW